VSAALLLSWREGVTTAAAGDGALDVQGPGGRVSLRQVAPVLLDALRRLAPPGEDEDRLPELLRGDGNGLFARAAGTDYYCETSVGEFLLGSQRHGPPGGRRLARVGVGPPRCAGVPGPGSSGSRRETAPGCST
jgi:hypothetical protein